MNSFSPLNKHTELEHAVKYNTLSENNFVMGKFIIIVIRDQRLKVLKNSARLVKSRNELFNFTNFRGKIESIRNKQALYFYYSKTESWSLNLLNNKKSGSHGSSISLFKQKVGKIRLYCAVGLAFSMN